MNKLNIAEAACGDAKLTDDESLVRAKKYANRSYEFIWGKYLWRVSCMVRSISATTAHELILPWPLEHVIGYRWDTQTMVRPLEDEWLFLNDPMKFETTGTPHQFGMMMSAACEVMPTTASRLVLYSDDTADNDVSVSIRGMNGNAEYAEQVTLRGKAGAMTDNKYTFVWQLAKGASEGNITVYDESMAQLLLLWPEENERKHTRIRLYEKPSTSKESLLMAKRRFQPMVHDEDTPQINNIDLALIEFTKHYLYEWKEQHGKALGLWKKGIAMMEAAYETHRYQAANGPEVGVDAGFDEDFSGMGDKYG